MLFRTTKPAATPAMSTESCRIILSKMRCIRSVDLEGAPIAVLLTVAGELWPRCTVEARALLLRSSPHIAQAARIGARLESTSKARQ